MHQTFALHRAERVRRAVDRFVYRIHVRFRRGSERRFREAYARQFADRPLQHRLHRHVKRIERDLHAAFAPRADQVQHERRLSDGRASADVGKSLLHALTGLVHRLERDRRVVEIRKPLLSRRLVVLFDLARDIRNVDNLRAHDAAENVRDLR